MNKIFFTITGTDFRMGHDFMQPDMKVMLVKEPDNKYDKEAIKIEMEGIGQVGYVANSVRTRIGDTFSAGRMYDKIGDSIEATIQYVMDNGVVGWVEAD